MLFWGKDKAEEKAVPAPQGAATPAPAAARASSGFAPVPAETSEKNLPNLLLAEGRITEAQLQQAMVKQAQTGQFIGEILIADGALDQDSLISFLAKHCKIPHLSLLDYLIDKDIVGLLPEELCLRCRMLPIDKLGKNLTVAMVNPLDADALAEVRRYCPDLRIKPILCAGNHFEIVSQRLFASAAGNEPMSLSASSLGLHMPKGASKEKPTVLPTLAVAPPAPAPTLVAPAAEPELPPLEDHPAPRVVVAPPTEEVIPEAEEIVPVTPLPEVLAVSAPAAAVLNGVFNEPPTPAGPPPKLEESGLGETASMMMKEMATVMMDSMRDTYAVLARRMELFRGVPPEEVAKIFARGITREFDEGAVIFEKGQAGEEMYVILGGEIIIKDGAKELARLTRGGMFGEMALLSSQPRSASAVAAETTSVLALSSATVRQEMPPHVSIQLLSNIITTLCMRLRLANAG